MPVAKVRGVNIFYQVIGDRGPWAALITGGRRGHDEFVPLATKLANAGYRVVLHDRRNTGRSDVLIEGDVAEEILWLDDLHELLKQLDAIPTFIGGSSAGARTAMRYYTRFRNDTRGLLLMRVTGGAFAAEPPAGELLRPVHQGRPGRRHGRGLRHRAIPGAHRRQSADPRPPDGDGPEAVHQGDVELAGPVHRQHQDRGVRHDRRRPGFDRGSDRRHPGQRPDPRLGERPHCRGEDSRQRAASTADRATRRYRSSTTPNGRPTKPRSRRPSSN